MSFTAANETLCLLQEDPPDAPCTASLGPFRIDFRCGVGIRPVYIFKQSSEQPVLLC